MDSTDEKKVKMETRGRGGSTSEDEEDEGDIPMVPLKPPRKKRSNRTRHTKSEDDDSESTEEDDQASMTSASSSEEGSTSTETSEEEERRAMPRKRHVRPSMRSTSRGGESSDASELERERQPWNLINFFRTEEHERAPSRIRSSKALAIKKRVTYEDDSSHVRSKGEETAGQGGAKPQTDGPKDVTTNSTITTESDSASDAQFLRRRRKSKKKDDKKSSKSKKTATWHSTDNPLFKTKMGDDGMEAVPLSLWFYEAVLNFIWPPFNYYRLHFLYISLLSIFGGLLIYLSQLGLSSQMSYMDALFHGVSAATQTGLFPTNFAGFSRLGQVILATVIFMGNSVLITLAPVVTRLWHFRKFFKKNSAVRQKTDEYFALWQLVIIVPTYYIFWISAGWLVLATFAGASSDARAIIDRNDNNPAWWGLFHTISAFGNCGYSTFSDNMVQWQTSPLPLITMSFLILAGNTAYPLMMRLIVFALYHMPFLKRYKHVYRYMLDHPRRCFTHLFPAAETRWLIVVLLFLNSVEFLFELMLDWNNAAFSSLNPIYKLVCMYFQTVAVRTSGFNSIDFTKLPMAILWLYTGMMYIAASPIAITVRYTGKSKSESIAANGREMHRTNTVGSQAQSIFVKHVVFIFIAILFICMIEEVPLRIDPNYSIFKIIFEVISAYGTVGLTLGYGTLPYSFCGVWADGSKFVLIIIMMLGKQRGLPESIDSAIMMPAGYFDETEAASDVEILSESESDAVVESDWPSGMSRRKRKSAGGTEEEKSSAGEKRKKRKDERRKKRKDRPKKTTSRAPEVLAFDADDIPLSVNNDDVSWLHHHQTADEHYSDTQEEPSTVQEGTDLERGSA